MVRVTETKISRFGAIVGTGAAIAFGLSALIPSAALAADTEETPPRTTETSRTPDRGTIMPNFTQEDLATDPDPGFSITIDNAPSQVGPGAEFTIHAHTTGFEPGNWINVWVKQADGTMLDAGGLIDDGDGQVEIPARLISAGANTIQLSSGTWPDEQWSQPISITVSEPELGQTAAVAFHSLSGKPVILATTRLAAFTEQLKPRNVTSFAVPVVGAEPVLIDAKNSGIKEKPGQSARDMQLVWTANYAVSTADGSLASARPGTLLDASIAVKCRTIKGPVYAVGQEIIWVTEAC